jgi:hypothetical protein
VIVGKLWLCRMKNTIHGLLKKRRDLLGETDRLRKALSASMEDIRALNRIGGPRAALLGHVTAPNRETALARAYDEFNVTTPAERKRIIVQRTSGT